MASKIEQAFGLVPVVSGHRDKVRDNKMLKSYDLRDKLLKVMENPKASPQAQASAGRTLAEMDGLIGRHQTAPAKGASVPVGQLSRAELEAELARLRDKCSASH